MGRRTPRLTRLRPLLDANSCSLVSPPKAYAPPIDGVGQDIVNGVCRVAAAQNNAAPPPRVLWHAVEARARAMAAAPSGRDRPSIISTAAHPSCLARSARPVLAPLALPVVHELIRPSIGRL